MAAVTPTSGVEDVEEAMEESWRPASRMDRRTLFCKLPLIAVAVICSIAAAAASGKKVHWNRLGLGDVRRLNEVFGDVSMGTFDNEDDAYVPKESSETKRIREEFLHSAPQTDTTTTTTWAAAQTWAPPPTAKTKAPNAQPAFTDALKGLSPTSNRHDGNPCGDDEELFEGLCYMKCALLTSNKRPVRCEPSLCMPFGNGKDDCSNIISDTLGMFKSPSVLPCTGFDVAGSHEGHSACPHPPGLCLKNEELYMGSCLKKCSLLTDNQFPHRTALLSCCVSPNVLRCLMPGNSRTDVKFGVGGGAGDGHPSTPAAGHPPLTVITEASK